MNASIHRTGFKYTKAVDTGAFIRQTRTLGQHAPSKAKAPDFYPCCTCLLHEVWATSES